MEGFNAKAIVFNKTSNGWKSDEVILKSVGDLRGVFSPYINDVEQVNLSLHEKVYYSLSFLRDNIHAKVTDEMGNRHFMVSPILVVLCDDTKPINITEDSLNFFKEAIDFC